MELTSRSAARTGRHEWIAVITVYHVDAAGAPATYVWSESGTGGSSPIVTAVEDNAIGLSKVAGMLEGASASFVVDDSAGLIRGWLTNAFQRELAGRDVVIKMTSPVDEAAAVTPAVYWRGQIKDYEDAGDFLVRFHLEDIGSRRSGRRIQLPTYGASFASCPAASASLKGQLPFGVLTDVSETNQGVVQAFHIGDVLDDHGNHWHGFALACCEITTINRIYIDGFEVAAGSFVDPAASFAAFGHGDYAHYFSSNYYTTPDGRRWTLIYVYPTHTALPALVSGDSILTANVVGAVRTGHVSGYTSLYDLMKQFAKNFLLPKVPFTLVGDWLSETAPTYDDSTAMMVDAVFDAAATAFQTEVHADVEGGFMLRDDFDVIQTWADLNVSADTATGFTREGQLGIWLESDLVHTLVTAYDEVLDIASLRWQDQRDPAFYFNVANYGFMAAYGTRGGTDWQHIVRGDDATSLGVNGEIWAANQINFIARRNSGAAFQMILRKAARAARARRVARPVIPLANFQQPLLDNVRLTDARGVGASGYNGEFVQTRASVASLAGGALTLEVWDLYKDHADHVDHDDHDDHTDHTDHTDHGDAGAGGHDDHDDHSDHQDDYFSDGDTWHIDHADHDDHADHTDGGAHVDHSDHADFSDHTDSGHNDHADHTDNVAHTDHDDHDDHVDHADHTDNYFEGETEHLDHADFDDHADHDDHGDVGHSDHADHSDHVDFSDHTDHTDHLDSPGHVDHDDHADHTDHTDHDDHGDHY